MDDFNAREFMTSNYLKKEELRTGGPRRFVIAAVAQADGLPGPNGKPAKKQLELQFSDESRFALRAQVNLNRVVAAFGERTSGWIGKTIEAYFSPDVTNPGGGPPGGIRLRIPETTPAAIVVESDLEEPPVRKRRTS